MIHCLISFFSLFFFFLEKYTKRQEQFCLFLMKTLLTIKYPVFIRVTNSNSKVHPFIDRMWWKPISARILGKWNIWFGEKPISSSCHLCLHFREWYELDEWNLPGSFETFPPTWSQTLIQQMFVAVEGESLEYSTKIIPWQWSSKTGHRQSASKEVPRLLPQ